MSPSISRKAPVYRDPIVVGPKEEHRATLIILHGRGSTAEKFATPLLEHTVAPLESCGARERAFGDYFRHVKLVFPTAPLSRAVAFKRSLTHQWFDNWSLTQPELKQHLQNPGLRETSMYLKNLIREEISVIGAQNVVLMGLSQGCAASLITTLLWTGDSFAAVVGMCGYLPLRKSMAESLEDQNAEEDSFFDRSEPKNDRGGDTKLGRAQAWLREELQVDDEQVGGSGATAIQAIPTFMGHGTVDEKVPIQMSQLATEFLYEMGLKVEQKEYEGLGHWYSEKMLRDVIEFLKRLEGWKYIILDD